LTKLLHIW